MKPPNKPLQQSLDPAMPFAAAKAMTIYGEMPQFGCGKTLSTYNYTALETARLEISVLWPSVEMKSP